MNNKSHDLNFPNCVRKLCNLLFKKQFLFMKIYKSEQTNSKTYKRISTSIWNALYISSSIFGIWSHPLKLWTEIPIKYPCTDLQTQTWHSYNQYANLCSDLIQFPTELWSYIEFQLIMREQCPALSVPYAAI